MEKESPLPTCSSSQRPCFISQAILEALQVPHTKGKSTIQTSKGILAAGTPVITFSPQEAAVGTSTRVTLRYHSLAIPLSGSDGCCWFKVPVWLSFVQLCSSSLLGGQEEQIAGMFPSRMVMMAITHCLLSLSSATAFDFAHRH